MTPGCHGRLIDAKGTEHPERLDVVIFFAFLRAACCGCQTGGAGGSNKKETAPQMKSINVAPSGPVANRSHLREETHAKPTESCNQMGTRSTDSTCAGIVVALVPSASCCMVPTASADFLPAGVRSSMQTVDNLREEGRAGQPTMTERCPPSTAVIVSQARAQRHCSTAAAYAYSASARPPPSPSRSSMRLFTATLATETNTFSPLPTSLENYRESVFFRPGEHPADAPRMCTAPLFVG